MRENNLTGKIKLTILLFFILLLTISSYNKIYNENACLALAGEISVDEKSDMILEKKSGIYTIKLDLTDQVLSLNIPVKDTGHIVFEKGKTMAETPLYPALNKLITNWDFVSASIISAKAKQFDDGLYAAVELVLQEGNGEFHGKKVFLSNINNSLKILPAEEAVKYSRAFIYASSELGGQKLKDNKEICELSENIKKDFLKNPLCSKPLGFYTWNDELRQIFQQDRLLQTSIIASFSPDKPVFAAPLNSFHLYDPVPLAEAIIKSRERDFYNKYLTVSEKLTNPFIGEVKDLRPIIDKLSLGEKPVIEGAFAFFPPSRSYETELIKELYGFEPIPEDFNLADKLIEEIKAGNIDITPKENSGWYDYQTYSLEPLILPDKFPESKRVEFSESYKKELLELFKFICSLIRDNFFREILPVFCLFPLLFQYTIQFKILKFIPFSDMVPSGSFVLHAQFLHYPA